MSAFRSSAAGWRSLASDDGDGVLWRGRSATLDLNILVRFAWILQRLGWPSSGDSRRCGAGGGVGFLGRLIPEEEAPVSSRGDRHTCCRGGNQSDGLALHGTGSTVIDLSLRRSVEVFLL